MSSLFFLVHIDGYWSESRKAGIPDHAGIFFVYTGSFITSSEGVSLRSLIYIGEADNLYERIRQHEKRVDWQSFLNDGEELWFSVAKIPPVDCTRVKAAFVYQHRPPANTQFVNEFPFIRTTIHANGMIVLLQPDFTL